MGVKRNHIKAMQIANKLIEGPNGISRISDGDWLEKDLHITIRKKGYEKIETFSLWTDCTSTREDGFLPPMIRILKWNRNEDLEELRLDEKRTFPNIELKLGTIKDAKFQELNQEFIRLQTSIKENNEYVPYKISTERDSAELELNDDYLDYRVLIRNGMQSLEIGSFGNYSDILSKQIITMISLLNDSIESADMTKWSERYYEITEQFFEGKFSKWDYYYRQDD